MIIIIKKYFNRLLNVKSTYQLISPVQVQHTNCKSNCNFELQLSTSQLQLQLADFGHLINYNFQLPYPSLI